MLKSKKHQIPEGSSAPIPPPRGNTLNSQSNNNNNYVNGNNSNNYSRVNAKSALKSFASNKTQDASQQNGNATNGQKTQTPENGSSNSGSAVSKAKLVFHCQQAQGSPTGLISGFENVKELYQKIADCYDFSVDEILFCTLNTHRVDMDCLLSAQLCLDDFIFAHRKGTKKEVEVTKTEDALGLTITDNGTGYGFIKRIKDGSVIDKIKAIQIGDHIEKIDDTSMVGWRHVDVAKYLKGIPVGTTFTMRLIEPLQAGFSNIGPKSASKGGSKGKSYGSGKETLRFKNNGTVAIEKAPDDYTTAAVEKINKLLENFMGINDADLATQIWDLASSHTNTMALAEAIDNSELECFGFTDDFIIELWGIVTDAKSGRLTNRRLSEPEEEEFDMSHLMNNGRKVHNRK